MPYSVASPAIHYEEQHISTQLRNSMMKNCLGNVRLGKSAAAEASISRIALTSLGERKSLMMRTSGIVHDAKNTEMRRSRWKSGECRISLPFNSSGSLAQEVLEIKSTPRLSSQSKALILPL